MSQDFGGRGRGRGRGGDRGGPRGFRGGSRGGFGDRGGGRGGFGDRGRGGFRGGNDRGMSRGGFRGDRGSSRGFRGSDRGGFRGSDRGGFRGSDRGGFRGSDRGGFRGSDRGGFRGSDRGGFRGGFGGAKKEIVPKEIQDGLQLYVIYKELPSVEDTTKKLEGFHSRFSRPQGPDSSKVAHFLLFKTVESMEAAKVLLQADDNVELVDYMGFRSSKNQSNSGDSCKLLLKFESKPEEAAVKELDGDIQSVEHLQNDKIAMAAFASTEVALRALKKLETKVGTSGLLSVQESKAMNIQKAREAAINRDLVVLRDVPKTTTLKDVAALYPDASGFVLYDNTFAASEYCHASLRFKNQNRVNELLEAKNLKILGKRVYAVPAHSALLQDDTFLGKKSSETDAQVAAAAKAIKESGPPSKKMKFEDEANGEEDSDEEDGEEEGDDEEEDGEEEGDDEEDDDEEGDEEGEDDGEDDDEAEDDDDDDDESD